MAVMLGLALVPLTLASLGAVDVASLYTARAELQDSLDAAALAAAKDGAISDATAMEVGSKMLTQGVGPLAKLDDLSMSFRLTDNGRIVEAQASHKVESIVFERFTGQPMIARAKTRALTTGPSACVIAFNPTAARSLWVSGSFSVTLESCSAYANSVSNGAFEMSGSSYLQATSVEVVGGAGSLGGRLDAKLNTGARPAIDPFGNVPVPAYGGCEHNALEVTNSQRFAAGPTPMVFCGGLQVSGGTVNFGPGIYVVRGGPLIFNGNTNIRGQGVTFLLADGATVQINGGADVKLSAPRGGATAGILFFQERVATGATNIFNGGADQDLDGALYFPKQAVRFNGNTRVGGGCTTLYADTVEWIGNAHLQLANCARGGGMVRLLE
ncbi:MAG TPA: pilus assembly protein TadG-related protein [Phenylobacterium sp.]